MALAGLLRTHFQEWRDRQLRGLSIALTFIYFKINKNKKRETMETALVESVPRTTYSSSFKGSSATMDTHSYVQTHTDNIKNKK